MKLMETLTQMRRLCQESLVPDFSQKSKVKFALSVFAATLVVGGHAHGWASRLPKVAAPSSAQGSSNLNCPGLNDGRNNGAGQVANDIQNLNSPMEKQTEAAYQMYGKFCNIQSFAQHTERALEGKINTWRCYHVVKQMIAHFASWMLTFRPPGGPASSGKEDLLAQGFADVLPSHPELATNPGLAPTGAIIVYGRNDTPCTLGKTKCNTIDNGDIQIRTPGGFANSFDSVNSMLDQPAGIYVKVIAVMIKPLKPTGYDEAKQCYNSDASGQ